MTLSQFNLTRGHVSTVLGVPTVKRDRQSYLVSLLGFHTKKSKYLWKKKYTAVLTHQPAYLKIVFPRKKHWPPCWRTCQWRRWRTPWSSSLWQKQISIMSLPSAFSLRKSFQRCILNCLKWFQPLSPCSTCNLDSWKSSPLLLNSTQTWPD